MLGPYKSLSSDFWDFCWRYPWYPIDDLCSLHFLGIPNFIESITGLEQSPITTFVVGTIALSLNAAAYIAEIVRGGFKLFQLSNAKPAAVLVSLYGKTMRKIIFATSD